MIFVRDYIERLVPETVCTIASLGYRFPATLVLENVMVRALGDDGVMYEDRQLLLAVAAEKSDLPLFLFRPTLWRHHAWHCEGESKKGRPSSLMSFLQRILT